MKTKEDVVEMRRITGQPCILSSVRVRFKVEETRFIRCYNSRMFPQPLSMQRTRFPATWEYDAKSLGQFFADRDRAKETYCFVDSEISMEKGKEIRATLTIVAFESLCQPYLN